MPKPNQKATKANSKSYTVSKTIFRKHIVRFTCPTCKNLIRDDLPNAGNKDLCPYCGSDITIPGIKELRELKREQDLQRYLSDDDETAIAKVKQFAAGQSPVTCGCLVLILPVLGLMLIGLVFGPEKPKPPSPEEVERLAAIQAEIDVANKREEEKRESIRQKVKQVEEFADTKNLLGLTDLAVVEARGFDASLVDFDLQKAKDLCQRNFSFLAFRDSHNRLMLEHLNYRVASDDDSALSVFQQMYSVSDENAEMACTEWIATNNKLDWNLDEVMAICLRNKAEGIKSADEGGAFKTRAAQISQRELSRLAQQQQQSGRERSSSSSYKTDVEKIIEAKAMVKRMLNYPNTAEFHNSGSDAPKVNGSKVTITVTAKNAFGVPETNTFTVDTSR